MPSYSQLHRTASSASLRQRPLSPVLYRTVPHSAGSHRRAASVPSDGEHGGVPPCAATIVLRPHAGSDKAQASANVFSFVPDDAGTSAPTETLPVVILGPHGTITGYIQMPVTAAPGRRHLTSKPRGPLRRKAVAPPPELYTRALPSPPPVPPTPPVLCAPPCKSATNRAGLARIASVRLTDEAPGDVPTSVTASPRVHVDQLGQWQKAFAANPAPPSAAPRSTLEEWQSAFGTYVPEVERPTRPESTSPPRQPSALGAPVPPVSPSARRKPSRMGMWKDMLRPASRRHRSDTYTPQHDVDVFARAPLKGAAHLRISSPVLAATGRRDVPDVPQDEEAPCEACASPTHRLRQCFTTRITLQHTERTVVERVPGYGAPPQRPCAADVPATGAHGAPAREVEERSLL